MVLVISSLYIYNYLFCSVYLFDCLFVSCLVEGDKITCVAPLVILGTVEPKMAEYHLNDVIQVSCNDGYELESQRSSLLFCTTQGRWKVFSAVEAAALPLPRCMGEFFLQQWHTDGIDLIFFIVCPAAKQRCPKLPSPVRGSVEYEVC